MFLEALITAKTPSSLIKNGDCLELRRNLISIKERTDNKTAENATPAPSDVGSSLSENNSLEGKEHQQQLQQQQQETSPNADGRKKRRIDEADEQDSIKDDEISNSKRCKVGDVAPDPPTLKRDFNLPPDRLSQLRRSPRLRKDISESWKSISKKSDGTKKRKGAP